MKQLAFLTAAVVALLSCILFYQTLRIIIDNFIYLPVSDHWGVVDQYIKWREGTLTLSDFVAQHNDHRIIIPKLIYFADLQFFGGQSIFLVVTIFLFQIGQFLLLVRTFKSEVFQEWSSPEVVESVSFLF